MKHTVKVEGNAADVNSTLERLRKMYRRVEVEAKAVTSYVPSRNNPIFHEEVYTCLVACYDDDLDPATVGIGL